MTFQLFGTGLPNNEFKTGYNSVPMRNDNKR